MAISGEPSMLYTMPGMQSLISPWCACQYERFRCVRV